MLGYQSARIFLDLDDGEPKPDPIRDASLPRAGLLLRAMFGNKAKGLNSAVRDSRELGDLAAVLASPEKVALLEMGRSVAEITRLSQPVDDRLRQGFAEIRAIQQEIMAGISEEAVAPEVAQLHTSAASANRRTAQAIERALNDFLLSPND